MKSITDYLISSGRKVSQNTVSDYVEALTESFVFYPVERFDIVGKQLLKINQKLPNIFTVSEYRVYFWEIKQLGLVGRTKEQILQEVKELYVLA